MEKVLNKIVGHRYKVIGNTCEHDFPLNTVVRFIGGDKFEYLDRHDFWRVEDLDLVPHKGGD